MGTKDIVSNHYLSDHERFAQIFNNALLGGRKLILPEKLGI